ncbi:PD40 domain-containing protein [Candidatus Poribacteria bacterium]|nr:PD40 domain-containing protein [Candidatus Poribacteria bacterium]
MLLGCAVPLISVRAQAPKQAQIAFVSYRDGNGEVYVMDAEGKNLRNLTNHPAQDGTAWLGPAWSPDGEKIAFVSKRDGNYETYVMDADGKNPRNLTNHPALDGQPAWSPDGQKIAFVSKRDGLEEIYVMDADGKNPHNLTNRPLIQDVTPSWFDPAIAFTVSSAGKLRATWGWLKQNRE